MIIDKNQAMIDFLNTCPIIQSDPMFFNFGNLENNAYQFIAKSDDVATHKPFIDGSVEKRFTFYLDNFKSVSYNPIVTTSGDENLEEFQEVQSVIDWITEQNEQENFPDFGNTAIIDSMISLTPKPEMLGVEGTVEAPLAVYRITIRIDYLDTSKKLWITM